MKNSECKEIAGPFKCATNDYKRQKQSELIPWGK